MLSSGPKMVRNAPSRPNSEFQTQIQNLKMQFQQPLVQHFKRIPSSSHSLGGGLIDINLNKMSHVPSPMSIQNIPFSQITNLR